VEFSKIYLRKLWVLLIISCVNCDINVINVQRGLKVTIRSLLSLQVSPKVA